MGTDVYILQNNYHFFLLLCNGCEGDRLPDAMVFADAALEA